MHLLSLFSRHNGLLFLLLFAGFLAFPAYTQSPGRTEQAIRAVMAQQEDSWNRGNLDDFMAAYWHSDNLRFIGSRGLTFGWEEILRVYRKGYPDQETMGKLSFTVFSVEKFNRRTAFVVGKWHLDRKKDELSGHFTLLWKKINGKWLIVTDHSS